MAWDRETKHRIICSLILAKKELQAKVILWTCRRDDLLTEAVTFCKEYGLKFDAINENLPEVIEWMHGDSRKIYADWYIDDRNCAVTPSFNRSTLERYLASCKGGGVLKNDNTIFT